MKLRNSERDFTDCHSFPGSSIADELTIWAARTVAVRRNSGLLAVKASRERFDVSELMTKPPTSNRISTR